LSEDVLAFDVSLVANAVYDVVASYANVDNRIRLVAFTDCDVVSSYANEPFLRADVPDAPVVLQMGV
jgi:hypothetical protein